MSVGGPGVGIGEAGGEVTEFGCGGGPEAEGAVDVDPGTGGVGVAANRGDGIEGAGVHVAGLGDNDGGADDGREKFGAEATLVIDGDFDDAAAAKAENAERFCDGGVDLGADDYRDGRGTKKTVGLDVPADAFEDGVAGSGEGAEVGHGGAGNERAGGGGREGEHIEEPAESNLLDDGGGGGGTVECAVLIPSAGEPVGGEGGRERAADDKAKKTRAGHRGGGGRADLVEEAEGVGGGDGIFGERSVEGSELRDGGGRGGDGAGGEAV